MLRAYLARRNAHAQSAAFDEAFQEFSGKPRPRHILAWTDEELHTRLASRELQPAEQSMAEAELRRRDAWKAQAAKAIWISLLALAVSIAAQS